MQIVFITSQRYRTTECTISSGPDPHDFTRLLTSVEFSFKAQKKHNRHHFVLRNSLQTEGILLSSPHVAHRV